MSLCNFLVSVAAVLLLVFGLAGTATPPVSAPASVPHAAAAPMPDANGIARAQQHIAEREYWASANAEGLQAPNRRHALRTYFTESGIRLEARDAERSALLGLHLARVGRPGGLAAVPAGVVHSDGPRVEIRRPDLVEWYLNGPAGLEQGFTLAQRPAGSGPLVLELGVAGAAASLQGERVVFETAAGRRLAYGNLVAEDATGSRLGAHLALGAAGTLELRVDDAGAVYPVAIDPLLTATEDTQLESNQQNALLGTSVAGAGDVNGDGYADVLVGAPTYDAGQSDEGAAFVFLGSASGIASGNPTTAAAQLESNQQGASLGWSVAGAGDVNGDGYADVLVGASAYDAGQSDEGAAFVFLGSASGVASGNPATAAARLESDQASASLGWSVAGAGDVNGDGYADVLVGASAYDAGQTDEGAAFVFLGSASGIASGNPATAAAQLESNQAGAGLGQSVAGAGDVNGDGYADVLVGAFAYDAGQTDEGAAFVFLGSASGIASGNVATAAAQLESNQAGAGLGQSVAGAGDVNGDGYADVLVGADRYDAGQTDEGAAFVFLGSAAGIASGNPATAAAQLESNQAGAGLGQSVAGAGDVNGDGYADVLVGASAYDAGQSDEGAAFVFLGSAAGIASGNVATAAAQLESDQAGAELGYSVAGAGDVNGDGYADLIVGAPFYDAGQTNEGAAFVFLGSAAGIASGNVATAAAQLESDQEDAWLGSSVAGAGDVNGDGYADLIVGAPFYDAGQTNEGAAFVFLGSAAGIASGNPATATAQLESDQAYAYLGYSVAGAGDVNGDGYADVVVGARFYGAGQFREGAAFVFLGSAAGIASGKPATAAAQLESDQADANLGWSVAGAGDVNGDGYADVLVGAVNYDAGQFDEGAAFVFLGSASGIASGNPATAAARLESDQASASLGNSVAGAGDVNGDGYADVIVGANFYDAGQSNEGAAFVFLGSAAGVASGNPATAAAQLESDQVNAYLGYSVAGAGDVNGDGYADVIVGAQFYDAGQTDEGAAFVFLGSASAIASGNPATAAARLESDQAGAFLGGSVAGAGDVNGDGYADVLVGADRYDAGQTDEGAAFVFLGSASGIASGNPATAAAQLESDQANASLGSSVAGAGDVNGDGYADVVVGANYYASPNSGGQSREGAAFVFLGNGAGRPAKPTQQRLDGLDTRPVQPWGGAPVAGGLRVSLLASHPDGTGRVNLEVQACPSGVPFEHASCVDATGANWTNVSAASPTASLTQEVAGLPLGLHRWRARVLHAPAAAIAVPMHPAHGPWRRVQAQAVEADIRLVRCGDGVVSLSESCDDGNTADADGCSATCTTEIGWSCSGAPSSCGFVGVCGNGAIEAAETCDDGNTAGADGCSASCRIETGWSCGGVPSSCGFVGVCGNGAVEGSETCDDGNTTAGDGCNASCQVEISQAGFDLLGGYTAYLAEPANADLLAAGVCDAASAFGHWRDFGNMQSRPFAGGRLRTDEAGAAPDPDYTIDGGYSWDYQGYKGKTNTVVFITKDAPKPQGWDGRYLLLERCQNFNLGGAYRARDYAAINTDVRDAIDGGLIPGFSSVTDHYVKYGFKEGRLTNSGWTQAQLDAWNDAGYLAANPDVNTYFLGAQSEGWKAFGKIGFAHWINFGQYEGRPTGQ